MKLTKQDEAVKQSASVSTTYTGEWNLFFLFDFNF